MRDISKLHIFTDFDGTITDTDSLVFLTKELGGGVDYLNSIGTQLRAGTMSLRDGITHEMFSIRAPFSAAAELLRTRIKVDPAFFTFAHWCKSNNFPLTVLSAGFHEIIELFIAPAEFPDLEILANHIRPDSAGWHCEFWDDSDYGHDKARVIQQKQAQGYHTIFIGDGISDRSAAEVADEVFATHYLAQYCREQEIKHHEFETFADILNHLQISMRKHEIVTS